MNKRRFLPYILIVSTIVSIFISVLIVGGWGFVYDDSMIRIVERVSTPFIIKVMDFISLIGSSEVILVLTAVITVIFILKKNWHRVFFFLTVSIGGVIVNFVLKVLFHRERPGEMKYIEAFNYSLEIPSFSFPSGHTMRSTILLLFLIYLSYHYLRSTVLKCIAVIIGTIIIASVGLSRIFLEAHFLSDTIAAVSISIVWFCVCALLFQRYMDKKTRTIYL